MKFKIITMLVFISLFLSCSKDSTSEPAKQFYLSGIVKDSIGNPVENAIIELDYALDTTQNKYDIEDAFQILFTVNSNEHVKLWITRKSNGELIKTLIDTTLLAGTHMIAWDKKNQMGKFVKNDVYKVNMKTSSTEMTTVRTLFGNKFLGEYANLEYYAKTDKSGHYQIDLSTLPLDLKLELNDSLNHCINSNVKIWAIKTDGTRSTIKTVKVEPNKDTNSDIVF